MTGYFEVSDFCWTHFQAEIQNYALSYMMGDNERISDATADALQFLTEHVRDVVGDDASGEDIRVAATDFFARVSSEEAAEAQYQAEEDARAAQRTPEEEATDEAAQAQLRALIARMKTRKEGK